MFPVMKKCKKVSSFYLQGHTGESQNTFDETRHINTHTKNTFK